MTPEELDRTIEFIIFHQARISAALDREQETRDLRFAEFEATQKRLAGLQERMSQLLVVESERLDRQDEMLREDRKRAEGFRDIYEISQVQVQQRHEDLLSEVRKALARLDQILDKLTDRRN